MRVWLILTIHAQIAEILPKNGQVSVKRVAHGIAFQRIQGYRKDPLKAAWENLEESVFH